MKISILTLLLLSSLIPHSAYAANSTECKESKVWFSILEAIKPKEIHLKEVYLCNKHVDLTFTIKPYIIESASALMKTIDLSKIGKPKFMTLDGNESSQYDIRIYLNE